MNRKNTEIHKALPFGEGWEGLSLVDEEKSSGRYEVTFNAAGLASGVYIFRLIAGAFVETKKMMLLR